MKWWLREQIQQLYFHNFEVTQTWVWIPTIALSALDSADLRRSSRQANIQDWRDIVISLCLWKNLSSGVCDNLVLWLCKYMFISVCACVYVRAHTQVYTNGHLCIYVMSNVY
jgi:hypothetical protein